MNRHSRRALEKQPRYQVIVEKRDGTSEILGPTAPQNWCRRVAEGINRRLAKGERSPLNITGATVAPVHMI